MIKGGKGGANTNKTGLKFEKDTDLKDVFKKLKGYEIRGNEVYFKGTKVAEMFQKNDLYKNLLSKHKINWKERASSTKKITLSIDLFYRGVSTRKVQEHLSAFYPHNADHRTILRWIVKYAKMIHSFTNKLKISCGKEIQIDEMEYKTKGQKSWFIDSIDTKTRYMVASEYTKTREKKELKSVLKTAKDKTENQIKICTTDGYFAYSKVIKNIFGYSNKNHSYNVVHNRVTQLKNEGFNHKIERLHNNIRQRTKTFRGFKNLDSANAIMKGWEVYYNFIMFHQAIKCCPYQLATDLKLRNPNKWVELIGLSKKQ
jgi:transposase-like protein